MLNSKRRVENDTKNIATKTNDKWFFVFGILIKAPFLQESNNYI